MGLKQNVINVLVSPPVRWVNFSFNNRMIAPMGFYQVASMVATDRIRCKTDSSLTNQAMYDPGSDTIIARDHSFGESYWDEKATLVHEAAHAMLDCLYAGKDLSGRSVPMLVVDDETMGYLAGAIYLIAGNAPSIRSSNKGKPDYEAMQVSKPKVADLMSKPWDGCRTIAFERRELTTLQNAIKSHEFYKHDWHQHAHHDGATRPA